MPGVLNTVLHYWDVQLSPLPKQFISFYLNIIYIL